MMSILADCCAGTQKQLVTDEIDSYEALNKYLIKYNDGDYNNENSDYERLVTISLNIINTDSIEIDKLISLRKREQENGGSQLRKLRHRYLKSIQSCVIQIANEARNDSDKLEIQRVFEQKMKDDLDALKYELKIEAKKVLLSKEMVFAVLAAAGTAFTPVSGFFSIGALMKKKIDYHNERRKRLLEHPMSWLYVSPNFQVL